MSLRSLKRPLSTDDLPEEKKAKRVRLPLVDIGNKLMSPPTTKPIKGTARFRSKSAPSRYPISPGEADGIKLIGDHPKEYIKGYRITLTCQGGTERMNIGFSVNSVTPHILPLTSKARIADLNNISPKTLSTLLQNEYADVKNYTIVDCRYPYEYEGGHIKGAINIWNPDDLLTHFFKCPSLSKEDGIRNIIVFHCEFSSKRGPRMCRFMRLTDRKRNGLAFPQLYYPELYLLHGGYKYFYSRYPHLCEPQSYKSMEDDKKNSRKFLKLLKKSTSRNK